MILRIALALTLLAGVASSDEFAPFQPVTEWEKEGLPGTKDGVTLDLEKGYAYLKSTQQPNGSWASPKGDHDVAATALALLSYLGQGHTHRVGPHKRFIGRALKFLKLTAERPTELTWLDASLRCMALGEAYAVSRDFTLKPRVETALAEVLALRADDGGWPNAAGQPSCSLATVWGVLALKAVKTSGISVELAAFEQASDVLQRLTSEQGLTGFVAAGDAVSLSLGKASAQVPLFTAGAAIARIFAGERRSVPTLRASADVLLEAGLGRNEPLYTYLATYATFQFGGKGWDAWLPAVESAIAHAQLSEGDAVGGWEPRGLVGELCGQPAESALTLMTLSIASRYRRAMGQGRDSY